MESFDNIYESALQRLNEYLETNQMRKTPERQEVLRTICLMPGLFTINELADRMQQDAAFCVSRTTLFNTLEVLTEARLVLKHVLLHTASYELLNGTTPRVYLVCQHCSTIRRMDRPELTRYLATVKTRLFTVRQPLLYLYGECKKCQQARKRNEKRKKQTN